MAVNQMNTINQSIPKCDQRRKLSSGSTALYFEKRMGSAVSV
jgi:hypothetical protein